MLMLGYMFNGNPVAYIVVHKPVQKQVIHSKFQVQPFNRSSTLPLCIKELREWGVYG